MSAARVISPTTSHAASTAQSTERSGAASAMTAAPNQPRIRPRAWMTPPAAQASAVSAPTTASARTAKPAESLRGTSSADGGRVHASRRPVVVAVTVVTMETITGNSMASALTVAAAHAATRAWPANRACGIRRDASSSASVTTMAAVGGAMRPKSSCPIRNAAAPTAIAEKTPALPAKMPPNAVRRGAAAPTSMRTT